MGEVTRKPKYSGKPTAVTSTLAVITATAVVIIITAIPERSIPWQVLCQTLHVDRSHLVEVASSLALEHRPCAGRDSCLVLLCSWSPAPTTMPGTPQALDECLLNACTDAKLARIQQGYLRVIPTLREQRGCKLARSNSWWGALLDVL